MSWIAEAVFEGEGKTVLLGREVTVPSKASLTINGVRGEPDAVVRFEVRNGRAECTEIVVTARPRGRGIQTSDMEFFNIESLIRKVFSRLGTKIELDESGFGSSVWPPAEEDYWFIGETVTRPRIENRRGANDEELEEVARIYRSHIDDNPLRAVETILSYKSTRTAARRVQQARAKGLLPKTKKGQKKA